jgi:hypothetical protein
MYDYHLNHVLLILLLDNNKRCHIARNGNAWERVEFERHIYMLEKTGEFVNESDIEPHIPMYMLEKGQIHENLEIPSIVFVFLPDDKAQSYGVTKALSYFQYGVTTQCVITKSFDKQRNDGGRDQYCGNIAMKVNAKLANISNGARVWNTVHNNNIDGIPWVSEVPTFVMGISLSNTLGQNSVSLIGKFIVYTS